jgi:predicted ester cyclase
MVAEGDQVWCRLRTSAVGQGEWLGLPPTGKPWTNTGIWFLRIADGKVIALEGLFDELNLVKQYGGKVVPEGDFIYQGGEYS